MRPLGILSLTFLTTASVVPASPGAEDTFCKTGLVVHAAVKSLILRDAANEHWKILTGDIPAPRLGEVAVIFGHREATRFQESDYFLSHFATLGQAEVPPPREMSVEELMTTPLKNERIVTTAEVEDYFIDDVDMRYCYLALKSGPNRIYGTLSRIHADKTEPDGLLGARIRLEGVVHAQHGARTFVGNRIEINDLQILTPAEKDLAKLPVLTETDLSLPRRIARLSRHQVTGTVLAVWHKEKILIRTPEGRVVSATLRSPQKLPHVGETVLVAGYPATDFFNLSLVGARWQPGSSSAGPAAPPRELVGNELFTDIHSNHSIDTTYHGQTVRLRGRVLRGGDQALEIELGQDTVTAHAGVWSSGFASLEPNSILEIAGVVVLESDSWREGSPFPRIRGVSLITRDDGDISVIRRPPWWTPTKILIGFLGLLIFIAILAVWNRILLRLAAKRSRELLREQLAKERSDLKTEERTRLAIELHDSLSQNLSGLGCQLVATRLALTPGTPAYGRLMTAERMLLSTRTELKRCLFDLREDLLEDPDFEHAIRQTLKSLLGGCHLDLRFPVARSAMDDSAAHAVLSIIRELASNAIIHGHATAISVSGSLESTAEHAKRLLFSVCDNGIGFDPTACAGPAEGHFGLTGIRDRINRAAGELTIESSPGNTRLCLSLPL